VELQNILGKDPSPKQIEELSPDLHATGETPTTLTMQSQDDETVSAMNSIHFYASLKEAGVPAKLQCLSIGWARLRTGSVGCGSLLVLAASGRLAEGSWPALRRPHGRQLGMRGWVAEETRKVMRQEKSIPFLKKMGWVATNALVALALLAPYVSAEQDSSPESLYKQATEADDHGDVQKAIALYQELLKKQPASVEARTNLGVALAKMGRYDEATAQYREALKRDPKNPVVRLNLALSQYKQADFQAAATGLQDLRKDHPEIQQSLYLLADCYLRLGRNSEVVELLEPAYRAHPEDRAIDYALGTALLREGKFQQGEAVIDRILKEGDTAEANLLMGEAQFAGGNYKEAAVALRKALELNPSMPGCWSLYGHTLLNNDEIEAAEGAFRKALEMDASDFSANLYLGSILRRGGKAAEAVPYLEKSLRQRPTSPEVRFQIAAAHAALGKPDDARREFERLEQEFPEFLEVHVQLAALYARLGLKQESERERAMVLQLNEKARETEPRPKP
jgi:Flp pilus assembly protein TadD